LDGICLSSQFASILSVKLPDYLPQRAKRVGVFVDETEEQIMETVQLFCLDMVQLHGHETPDFAAAFAARDRK